MQLTPEDLKTKIEAAKADCIAFARQAQAEINAIQQVLSTKMRESQKGVDNREGAVALLEKFLADIKTEVPGGSAAPDGIKPPTAPNLTVLKDPVKAETDAPIQTD